MGMIYVLRNRLNGKCYVGQTVKKISDRVYSHKKLRNPIGLALLKYGQDNFETLYYFIPEGLLDHFEIELIKRIGSLCPNGYNLIAGGQTNRASYSDATREKMRMSHLGKTHPLSQRQKQSAALKGKKKSPEHCRRISEGQKGKIVSQLTRERIAATLMGNVPWNKGKPQSEEQRKLNSESHRGLKASPETRLKMSITRTGKKCIRIKSYSDEYKRNMSTALKALWLRRKGAA